MRTSGLVLCLVGLSIVPAQGMFIRHDVPDELYLKEATRTEFDCVGLLLRGTDRGGSCVLIGPRTALTDAHVVEGRLPTDFKVEFGGTSVGVSEIKIHPDYRSKARLEEKTPLGKKGFDIALITLSEDPCIKPAAIYDKVLTPGSAISMVGFGVFGTGASLVPQSEPKAQKRAGTNVIDRLGGDFEGEIPPWLYVCDFDGPSGSSTNRCGDPTPTRLECLGTGGDSGGGAFVELEGRTWLVGLFSTSRFFDVESAKPSGYGHLSMFTRLDLVLPWVQQNSRKAWLLNSIDPGRFFHAGAK